MSDELKPCPFCGYDRPYLSFTANRRLRSSTNDVVVCPCCSAEGPIDTRIKWNARTCPDCAEKDRKATEYYQIVKQSAAKITALEAELADAHDDNRHEAQLRAAEARAAELDSALNAIVGTWAQDANGRPEPSECAQIMYTLAKDALAATAPQQRRSRKGAGDVRQGQLD